MIARMGVEFRRTLQVGATKTQSALNAQRLRLAAPKTLLPNPGAHYVKEYTVTGVYWGVRVVTLVASLSHPECPGRMRRIRAAKFLFAAPWRLILWLGSVVFVIDLLSSVAELLSP